MYCSLAFIWKVTNQDFYSLLRVKNTSILFYDNVDQFSIASTHFVISGRKMLKYNAFYFQSGVFVETLPFTYCIYKNKICSFLDAAHVVHVRG